MGNYKKSFLDKNVVLYVKSIRETPNNDQLRALRLKAAAPILIDLLRHLSLHCKQFVEVETKELTWLEFQSLFKLHIDGLDKI